jgi:hypothetical protein
MEAKEIAMNKFKTSAVATLASALMVAAPATAASPGQLQGGSNTYVVKNVTKGGAYANSVSAVSCGDTIKYSIQLSNTGFGALHSINVKASLGSTSNMTAVPAEGAAAGTSGSVNVALGSNQSLVYDSGSTQLYDGNGNVVKTLSDGITSGGVNVGDLAGSTNEFVNFTAKVNCPSTPVTPSSTPQVTPASTTLPATGPEAALGGIAGTGALGYAVMQYRRSRKALAEKLLDRK